MRYRLRTLLILLAVGLPVVTWPIIVISRYVHRPMFAEVFGQHEMAVLPSWHGMLQIGFDREGTAVKIDRPLNVIAVFRRVGASPGGAERDSFKCWRFAGSLASDSEGARLERDDGVVYLIPRRANRLFVFEQNGTRHEYPLAEAKATECYDSLLSQHLENRTVGEVLRSFDVDTGPAR